MNFLEKSISFKVQNSIKNNESHHIQNDYYIKKLATESYSFVKKTSIIQENVIVAYATVYYVYPNANAIVLRTEEKKWVRYIFKNGEYTLDYISTYFILSFKNNLLIMGDRYGLKLCKYKQTDAEIVIEQILINFSDFIIDGSMAYFISEFSSRKITYDLSSNSFVNHIMKLDNNKLDCKKTTIYFDNLGGLEIYDNKKHNVIFQTDRYYKLEKFLYVLKENHRYILKDLQNNLILFTGSNLHYINNNGWILDKKKNEIALIQPEEIILMNYTKYTKGNSDEILKKYKRKTYE
jgi:hypothetical protein